MALERRAVGIDLGSRAIRVVDLRVSSQGVVVHHALRLDRARLLEKGDSAEDLARALREKLAEARIPTKDVVLGLSGPDTMIRYTRIPPVPAWRLKVVMQYEVREIAEKIGEPLASDFQVLQIPREADTDQTILIGLVKERPFGDLLDALESQGITVRHALLAPLALFVAHDAFGWKPDPTEEEDDLALLADLGAENLSFALLLNERLVFARSISFGGRNFTESLAQQLGVDAKDAERVKIARGGVDEGEPGVHKDTVRALSMMAGQLFGTLQSSVRFSATQTGTTLPALSRLVLFGGGMRLRGLDGFLGKGFGKPAEFFQPAGVKLSSTLPPEVSRDLSENAADYGVALGLGTAALRGDSAGQAKTSLSILPEKYVKRREFRDRTLFIYAAGALLLLAVVVKLGYGMYQNSVASDTHQALVKLQVELQQRKREYDDMKREGDVRRGRLNRMLLEAEQSSFQAYLLDLLARALRPEMKLERVYLDDTVLTADGTTSDYGFYVECRVSNEKRQGLQWIGDLEETLRGEERIASVETVSSDSDRAWRTFKLVVKPNYVSY